MPNHPVPPKQNDQLRAAAESASRRIFVEAFIAGSDVVRGSPVLSHFHRAHAVKAVILLGAIGMISTAVAIRLIHERALGDAAIVGALALMTLFGATRPLADIRRASRASETREPAT